MVGKTLGHYQILDPLGSGGMGDVYRAHDATLKRDVAVKLLPADLAGDPDRLARLEREAHLLAALNHPNIATIYSLEEIDGTSFLVMELVKGESLERLLERGPLPIGKALELCAQIARALEAAHAEGIIHRDLKPANVLVTPDRRVKVLDFGLAKPATATGEAADADLSRSPTVTVAGTQTGVILGTAPYMSPEQVRGRPLDQRADIWAFGCVLYETLAGRRAFDRETVADTLAAVIEAEPDWDALPTPTPAMIVATARRCLRKDAGRRLHDIADARVEIDDEIHRSAAPPSGAVSVPAARHRWQALAAAVFTLLVVVLAAWFYYSRDGRPASDGPPTPARVERLAARIGVLERYPALSPDGDEFVYAMPGEQAADDTGAALGDLFALRVGGRNRISLTATPDVDERYPAYSPDGSHIAYTRVRESAPGVRTGEIWVMERGGENPRRVTDFGFDPSWSPGGDRIFFGELRTEDPDNIPISQGGIWVVELAGDREPRPIFEAPAGWIVLQPQVSPHSHRIAFWGVANTSGDRDIWTIPVDGGQPVPVTGDDYDSYTDFGAVWAPSGDSLFFGSDRGGSWGIWRVAIDEATGVPLGDPVPVTSGRSGLPGHLSFSRDGTRLAYEERFIRNQLVRAAFDAESLTVSSDSSAMTRISDGPAAVALPEITDDGTWVAYMSLESQMDIWVADRDGNERQLTNDPFKDFRPIWAHGDRTVFFYSDRGGSYDLWAIESDGNGLRRVTETDYAMIDAIASPDGRRVAFDKAGLQGLSFLGDITEDPAMFVESPFPPLPDGRAFHPHDWSSDGLLLLGDAWGPVNNDLFVFSVEAETYQRVGPFDGGAYPFFLADTRHVFYLTQTGRGPGQLNEYFILDLDTGTTEQVTRPTFYVGALRIAEDMRDAFFRTGPPSERDVSLLEFNR